MFKWNRGIYYGQEEKIKLITIGSETAQQSSTTLSCSVIVSEISEINCTRFLLCFYFIIDHTSK